MGLCLKVTPLSSTMTKSGIGQFPVFGLWRDLTAWFRYGRKRAYAQQRRWNVIVEWLCRSCGFTSEGIVYGQHDSVGVKCCNCGHAITVKVD